MANGHWQISGTEYKMIVTPSTALTTTLIAQDYQVVMAPIGTVKPWMKSMTSCPALATCWVECNGQALSDTLSPYNGQTIPNLNSGGNFIRANATSGSTGGTSTHTHDLSTLSFSLSSETNLSASLMHTSDDPIAFAPRTFTHGHPEVSMTGNAPTASTEPKSFTTVFIMRVR